MTNKQRENIAKALFDISKLVMAIGILGNTFGKNPFSLLSFTLAVILFILCFILAILIDK